MPAVSVVMPTHNRADLIGEAIRSALAQTFRDFDVHVIDNGSTDDTKEVVESFGDERLNYFWKEDSGLPADSRNVGIARSRGEFIAFLDSDDLWLPDKLERQVKAMRANPNCGLVACNYARAGEHPLAGRAVLRRSIPTGKVFEKLLYVNFISTSMAMARRSALEKVGLFHIDPAINCSEDFDLWLRITHDFEFEYIEQVGGLYRIHESNLGEGGASARSVLSPVRVVERVHEMYRLPRKLRDSALAEHYAKQAFHFLLMGDAARFRESLRQGARRRWTIKGVGLRLGRALLGTSGLIRLFRFLRSRGLNPGNPYVR